MGSNKISLRSSKKFINKMAWIMTGDFIGLAVKVLVSGRSFNAVLLFTIANYQC